MKKLFKKACKELGVEIIYYNSFRSDMGCQEYKIILSNGIEFHDGMWIGSSKDEFISLFKAVIAEKALNKK